MTVFYEFRIVFFNTNNPSISRYNPGFLSNFVLKISYGLDSSFLAEVYGVTESGNFEGSNILNRLDAIELRDEDTEFKLAEMRAKLLARRATRVRPALDDKVLADWNGLMISALTNAGTAFDKPDWTATAEAAFDFIFTRMTSEGRLFHTYRNGVAKAPATANDYANMILAALALANATNNPEYVEQACAWTHVLDVHYWSDDLGGYCLAADDTNDLIVRPFSSLDDATPNPNATMISNLTALSLWTGEVRYANRAHEMLRRFSSTVAANLVANSGMIAAAIDAQALALVVLMVPQDGDVSAMRAALRNVSLPNVVVDEVWVDEMLPSSSPAFGKMPIQGKTTAYVCLGPQCSLPVIEPEKLVETIKSARQATVA